METLCVNTPIGVLTVEVTGNSFSTAGGISVYLQDSDANFYPLIATEFNSRNNSLETTVFQDQEHIEEPVEIRHSGLPETDNPYENKVVKPVTMLEYLKQMHPTFQKSIENIQEITEDPLRYFCKQEAETLLDNRKNHEKHGKMVKELQEKLLGADHFNNLDWECSIADEVSDSYELQMRELLSDDEDEYIMKFSHTGNPYVAYHCMKDLLPCFVSRDCSEVEYEVNFALYGLREKIDTIVENLKTENFSDNGKSDGTSGIYQLSRPDIETIIDYCNDLAADEKLEVFEFGEDCDLVLHIYKDEEYNASKDKDSYNIVSISTARNGEWVDDTEDVYVTDGSLANELDRIYHYREFATK